MIFHMPFFFVGSLLKLDSSGNIGKIISKHKKVSYEIVISVRRNSIFEKNIIDNTAVKAHRFGKVMKMIFVTPNLNYYI